MGNNNFKPIRSIILVIALTALLPTLSCAQEYVTTKIHHLYPKPIVKVTINGKPAYLLLDTGSDIDLLHSGDAKKYKFSILERENDNRRVSTLNGIEGKLAPAVDLSVVFGGKQVSNDFLTMDLERIVKSIRDNTGITITGLIGSATMKNLRMVIDYKRGEIAMKTGI